MPQWAEKQILWDFIDKIRQTSRVILKRLQIGKHESYTVDSIKACLETVAVLIEFSLTRFVRVHMYPITYQK